MDSERILGSIPAPLSIDQSGVFLVIASRPQRGTNDLFQVETEESLEISYVEQVPHFAAVFLLYVSSQLLWNSNSGRRYYNLLFNSA